MAAKLSKEMREFRERQWRDIEASGAAVWVDEFGFAHVDGNAYLAWIKTQPPSEHPEQTP